MPHDERAAAFATRLKAILKDRKLTQLQVMRDTTLSQQAISGWCRGLHLPRAEALQELAAYLDMEPRALCPEAFDDAAVKMSNQKSRSVQSTTKKAGTSCGLTQGCWSTKKCCRTCWRQTIVLQSAKKRETLKMSNLLRLSETA